MLYEYQFNLYRNLGAKDVIWLLVKIKDRFLYLKTLQFTILGVSWLFEFPNKK